MYAVTGADFHNGEANLKALGDLTRLMIFDRYRRVVSRFLFAYGLRDILLIRVQGKAAEGGGSSEGEVNR
jgi:hypothetical protein